MKRIAFILILFIITCKCSAQLVYCVHEKKVDELTNKKKPKSKYDALKQVENVIFQYHNQGHLLATLDSLVIKKTMYTAYLDLGEIFYWKALSVSLSTAKYEGKLFNIGKKQVLSRSDLISLLEDNVSKYENSGYPFVKVQLTNIVISGDSLSAKLKITPNKHYQLDSLIILNDELKPVKPYLENYLGWHEGDAFSQKKLKSIPKLIKDSPFLKLGAPPKLIINDQQAKLQLDLKKRRASRFDGIIGFQPDRNTGEIKFTGNLDLSLQNALNRGEKIEFSWKRIEADIVTLNSKVAYPYLFDTKFGVVGGLDLYRRDTIFSTSNLNIGFKYLFTGFNYFGAFYTLNETSLLSTKGLKSITSLPKNADASFNSYGLNLNYENYDYRFNPLSGFRIFVQSEIGIKEIIKHPKIPSEVYDNVKLKTLQSKSTYHANVFLRLSDRSTIKFEAKGAGLYNKNIFENEMFRLGGLKTLRGFDEESIFASQYHILTIEPRLKLETNSFLHLFFDAAYYEYNSSSEYISDLPFGFGAGFSFETKAGIFSLTYALGQQRGNPILIRASKIHFGFINYF